MRWLALLLFAGCVPPVAPLPVTPAAPVLDPVSVEQHRRLFNLRGVVATETAVRLFTDTACAGPLYRQVTAVEFAKGVPVELVGGADNVFSANAVSSLGATSACSAPVRVRYAPLPRPGRPSVASHPDSPSWQTHFTIAGASDLSARVRLHDGTLAFPHSGHTAPAASPVRS